MREKFRLNEAAVHPVKIEHTRALLTKNGTKGTGKYENSVYYGLETAILGPSNNVLDWRGE